MSEQKETEVKEYVEGLKMAELRSELKRRKINTAPLKKKSQLRQSLIEILINEESPLNEEGNLECSSSSSDREDLDVTIIPAHTKSKEDQLIQKEKEIMAKEREILLKENELLRQELALLRLRNEEIMTTDRSEGTVPTSEKFKVNVGHVTEMIPKFDPDYSDFEAWEQQAVQIMKAYSIQPDVMKTIMVSKLRGRAQRFFYSKPTYIALTLSELLIELGKMFRNKQSKMNIRRKFEERLWQPRETFADYYHDKIIMANSLDLDLEETIEYIIEGMADPVLEAQAKIQRFESPQDLFDAFVKVKKVKATREIMPQKTKKAVTENRRYATSSTRCFNCNIYGHSVKECKKPTRERGSCFICGKFGHYSAACPESKKNITPLLRENRPEIFKQVIVSFSAGNLSFSNKIISLLDTGSSISLIREDVVPPQILEYFLEIKNTNYEDKNYYGINNSKLRILTDIKINVNLNNEEKELNVFVVPKETMSFCLLLGRDFMSEFRFNLVQTEEDDFEEKLLLIDVTGDYEREIKVGAEVNEKINEKFMEVFRNNYLESKKPERPRIDYEMEIRLIRESPFHCNPRRLSFYEKSELQKILQDLENRNIIRTSESPYCSPIVLVKKKNGEYRLCVDYRQLNKITERDNYPLPLIEDHIADLHKKRYYSLLDLKSGFHQVRMAKNSVKYTSFITPLGQFEYTRMPFGLRNAPSVFQRFINRLFRDLINSRKVLVYIDDILIATETLDEHLEVMEEVFKILSENLLEIRLDKCKFLCTEIEYLGYLITNSGIKPNPANLRSISEFPVPSNLKQVHSFLGLCSYFRKFIQNFALLSKPLYDLLKKDAEFKFDEEELRCFNILKQKLMDPPVLAIYSPVDETELHCDASSIGYGSILMQKKADGKFHPVFYFSKRTTPTESKYHSYELETLSIIYALKRFRVYLQGIKFKIVTDCNSLILTLNKKDINPRIARWALELQNYDYSTEHRVGGKMNHVDALSRSTNILVLEDNTTEQNLAICQSRDRNIQEIRKKLEKREDSKFEMRNGLVYKKVKDGILFYVPREMEIEIIRSYHEMLGHSGTDKCYAEVNRTYWFPRAREKIKNFIQSCFKCIAYSSKFGKQEGILHNIPKGELPFEVLHIDHYGPLRSVNTKRRYIFEVIDTFTKFVKLYPVRTTSSREAITCLKNYFTSYSKPSKIVSDRGTCFTSSEFKEFMEEVRVQHIKIAVGSPQANGQIERVNESLTPMIAKLCSSSGKEWDKTLPQVEFALNNTVNRSIGKTPSQMLFGVNQKGCNDDPLKEKLGIRLSRSLEETRAKAVDNVKKAQSYAKKRYDRLHRPPRMYKKGDYVMITNYVSTPGVNKKLVPKFRGPYTVAKVLPNDRYLVKDVEGHQITQLPYSGIVEPRHMKLWKLT